jgi:dTDP-4-dehydrorhamnose reductase
LKKLKKNKILVLGISGMLGVTLFQHLSSFKQNEVYGTLRDKKRIFKSNPNIFYGYDAEKNEKFFNLIEKLNPDYVINCIGIIKQRDQNKSYSKTIFINSIFPKNISSFCTLYKIKFIQISTDCVYDGKKGNYYEYNSSNAKDLYGMSKYLGEVYDNNHLTIRTSIIGNEIRNKKSLLEWVISQNNDKVFGYMNAIYSGLTTLELSKIINKYFLNFKFTGLYHVSSKPISKYDLIKLIIIEFGLKIKLLKNSSFRVDRSLNDKKFRKISGYKHKPWKKMIKELKDNQFHLNQIMK